MESLRQEYLRIQDQLDEESLQLQKEEDLLDSLQKQVSSRKRETGELAEEIRELMDRINEGKRKLDELFAFNEGLVVQINRTQQFGKELDGRLSRSRNQISELKAIARSMAAEHSEILR